MMPDERYFGRTQTCFGGWFQGKDAPKRGAASLFAAPHGHSGGAFLHLLSIKYVTKVDIVAGLRKQVRKHLWAGRIWHILEFAAFWPVH